jgi:hypothetical protein
VDPDLIEEMFVQGARGAVDADGLLTLTSLAPTTLYFSDRPERHVGHMTTERVRRPVGRRGQQLRVGPAELARRWRSRSTA